MKTADSPPNARRSLSEIAKTLAGYFAAVGLTTAIVYRVLDLKSADLSIPFVIWGDSRLYRAIFKGMIENGWYVTNPSLGTPYGMDLHDWPPSDYGNFLLVKLISVFFPHAEATFNLYYILSFPVTAVSALFVLRSLGITFAPALAGSLLFAFLPFHFLRIDHVFLCWYYLVPLLVLVALWIARDEEFLLRRATGWWRPYSVCRSARSLASIAIIGIAAASGTYSGFFGCFFLLIAGLYGSALRRNLLPLARAALLVVTAIVTLALCLAPTIDYQRRNGPNTEAIVRSPDSAEEYGLKITTMLFPHHAHRLPELAQLRMAYNQGPLNNENASVSLGVVGSFGFLALIAALFFPPEAFGQHRELRAAAFLNLFGVLLATIGGFGSTLAWLGITYVRGYNRISVFLGFFSIFAVVLFVEWLRGFCTGRLPLRYLYAAGLTALVWIGVADQTSLQFRPPYERNAARYRHDAEFIAKIEASLPHGAMVFQLPYMKFPEGVTAGKMIAYEHLEAYLHSHTLRWSFGAMRGREGDRWLADVAALPLQDMVTVLSNRGFSGIYLDKSGYEDGEKVAGELARVLGAAPLLCSTRRLAFFSLREFGKRVQSALPQAEGATASELLPSAAPPSSHATAHEIKGRAHPLAHKTIRNTTR